MAYLRKIHVDGVTRRDRIRNEEIFNRLNIRIGIVDKTEYGTNGYNTLDI